MRLASTLLNETSLNLLLGMLQCGHCGSVMGAESRPSGDSGNRIRVYWCRNNRRAERAQGDVCGNNVVVPMQAFARAVIATLEPYLTPDVIADAVKAAVKRAGSRAAMADERARLDRELKTVEAELAHLVAFIKRGWHRLLAELYPAPENERGDSRLTLVRSERQRD